jgi:hypothetical protein
MRSHLLAAPEGRSGQLIQILADADEKAPERWPRGSLNADEATQRRSKRSAFITLTQAETKSRVNLAAESD